jgi:hypothetical protein
VSGRSVEHAAARERPQDEPRVRPRDRRGHRQVVGSALRLSRTARSR